MDAEAQRALLKRVYQHFHGESRWPLAWRLALDTENQFGQGFDLELVAQEIGPELIICGIAGDQDSVCRLTLRGIEAADPQAPELTWFLRAAHFLATQYRDRTGPTTVVSETEIATELGLDQPAARRVCRLLYHEMDIWTGAGTSEGSPWSFTLAAGVSALCDVKTLAEYFERRADYQHRLRRRSVARSQRMQGTPSEPRAPLSWGLVFGDKRLEGQHTRVVATSAALFRDGHYAQAVREAFQAFEFEVQQRTGEMHRSGLDLMGKALGGDPPAIPINLGASKVDTDEQNGVAMIAKGAMSCLRNMLSHGPQRTLNSEEAMDALSIASFLFRKLDQADALREARSQTASD